MEIFFGTLYVLAIAFLLIQLWSVITYLRQGNISLYGGNTFYVLFLFFIVISIVIIPHDKNFLYILILIVISKLVSFGIGLFIATIDPYAPWLTYPLRLISNIIFKIFTLGVSHRKIWLAEASSNYIAVIDAFGEQEENKNRRGSYYHFIKEVIYSSFCKLDTLTEVSINDALEPCLNLFLVGAFEAFYNKEITPYSSYFNVYTGEFFYVVNLIARKWKVLDIVKKDLPSIFSNLYFVHLEPNESLKKGLIKGKDLLYNYHLFEHSPDLENYFKGKKIAKDFIDSKNNPTQEFNELFLNWLTRPKKTFQNHIDERIAWKNWR
jgi:hypothetical protein